jgi:UDP-MurNAc hydroxylase
LKVRWFRSATVSIESASGTKILCDPWLTDGAYIGSWFHWPPLQDDTLERVCRERWDAIYVSHLHPDHFDRRTLSKIVRQHPGLQVVIPDFAHPWLRRAVLNCGVSTSKLSSLGRNDRLRIGDVDVTILTADACSPDVCGVSIPCSHASPNHAAIDSLAVFEADGRKVVNANDALAVSSVWRVLATLGEADLLMAHYGGAGPFPQCFTNLSKDEKVEAADRTSKVFLDRLVTAANAINAKYVLPFAGQYQLAGRLVKLNRFRSMRSLSESCTYIRDRTAAEVIALAPFASFDLTSEAISEPWREPSSEDLLNYLDELRPIQFPYESLALPWNSIQEDVQRAFSNLNRAWLSSPEAKAAKSDTSIVLKGDRDFAFALHCLGDRCFMTSDLEPRSEFSTTIEGPDLLWNRLIRRRVGYQGFTPFHFNQAEIGSHFSWHRSGGYTGEFRFLNFFQSS